MIKEKGRIQKKYRGPRPKTSICAGIYKVKDIAGVYTYIEYQAKVIQMIVVDYMTRNTWRSNKTDS